MKILFISQYFFPEQFSNNSIAKYLAGKMHDVKVVTCVPNYPGGTFFDGYSNRKKRYERWNSVEIFRAWTYPRGKRAISLVINYVVFPLTASFTAYRSASDASLSFVSMPSPVFQAFVGVFMKWTRGIPTVYWVQDIWPESASYTMGIKSPFLVKPLNWLCGFLYRRADLILVQSEAFLPMIERFGVAPHRIRFYPNSAPRHFKPIPAREAGDERELIPPNKFCVMFAGSIGESQDFDTIIEAAKLLDDNHDISWVIVGSGRDMDRVKRKVSEYQLEKSIFFLGRHDEEKMPNFFAHADAMLVILKKNPIFSMTVPYKVQCYMACAKPIIAALDGEGARIINEAEAGVTSPAGSPSELANAVLKMKSLSVAERHDLGTNGREYYLNNYDEQVLNSRLEQWFCEIVSRKKNNSDGKE